MQIIQHIVVAFASLAVFRTASAADSTPHHAFAPVHDITARADAAPRQSNKYCRDITFLHRTSFASPLVDDCKLLAFNIGKGGDWSPPSDGWQRRVAGFGTCAFGAAGRVFDRGGKTTSEFTIGNQDVIDLIAESIHRYQYTTREGDVVVGSEGFMRCTQDGDFSRDVVVNFGIYHSGEERGDPATAGTSRVGPGLTSGLVVCLGMLFALWTSY
ncbi:putative necrosis-inducing factor-domain-containing protein [Lasiosphaeria hispida]|uniref:Necrosis-inducing factor-domain-containing protein n=1 Tax=Lasiosphaeria hispida TaxID=260671 RepID=A0AAJ0MB80_9PEZI|nr:putative necrosis-inducing factor-domain-containing protein [Lasiosphaeria hispida]